MRIAVVHPFSWPDVRRGGERYAHDLSWWLAGQGHQVDYVTGGPERSVETVDGARLVRLHHRHGDRLTGLGVTKLDSFGAAVLPWLTRNRYDVVHALVPTAAIAARSVGQRVVYTAIGHPIESGTKRARDLKLLTAAARAANVVTALSDSAANAARGLTGRPVWVTSPGIRPEAFRARVEPRDGPARLLFPANAGEPRKRLSTLLAAMPLVLEELPDARLWLGGGGAPPHDLGPDVAAAIDDLGVGSLDEVPQRYRDATVTVLPSVDEAFGLVLVESLASGTPVVASDSGGMPEIVTSAVGRLAIADDAADLARGILEAVSLARDPATPTACAEHSGHWTWDVVGPHHLAAYERAITGERPAAANDRAGGG
jgi:phosphatidylinositol alpha-mannosyltransferase